MPGNVISQGSLNLVASTTNQATSVLDNVFSRGVKVVVVTSVIGTGSITITIQGVDKASGTAYTLLAGAAIVTNTTNVYTVYPTGIAAVANVTAVDALPGSWRITVTANNANPVTASVGWSTLA